MVGAVIVRNDLIVGEGYHRAVGMPHAEVEAIRAAGDKCQGADLYVTLEPCNHHGRTPPCTQAILKAGIRRVLYGMADPNPGVTGGGAQALEAQGLEVHGDILREQCEAVNEVFMVNVIEHRPFGFLKMAMSLDGRIATKTGHSQWITSPPARRQVHRLRDRVSAVMVGIGTVLADDPRLTVRLPGARWRNPVRVIADSDLRIPLDSALFEDLPHTELIVACKRKPNPEKKKTLEAAGAMVIETSGVDRVDLAGLSDALFDRGITSVLVEGGAGMAWGALEAGIIDRCLFYYAPMIIGGTDAPSGVSGEGAETLQDAFRLEGMTVSRVGDDLSVSGKVLHSYGTDAA